MSESIAEVRRRSWETRRKKYGNRGHSGPYCAHKPIYTATWNARLRTMQDALIRLYREGVLSEGQVVKATGMDRLSCREAAIEQRKKEVANCKHNLETHCDTDINGAGVHREYWKQCTKCKEIFAVGESNDHGHPILEEVDERT